MPNIRVGYGSDFVVKDQKVGIGSEDPRATLDVRGTIKGDFNIAGVSTLTSYSGFAAQKQNVTKESTTGISTVGVGTFVQSYETETGNLELVGQFNTVSEDIIVDEGKIFEITTTNITGITTLGTQEVYAPDPSVVSVGTLESVSIQSHFSVPDGGISERVDNPIEGSVRFNDDLNTLEFYNGVEWRQFTVTGASGRGVFGGGNPVSMMDFVNISSTGNAINFGSLSVARRGTSSCSSSTRGLFGGGYFTPSYSNVIDYITLASEGNAVDFGDLLSADKFSSSSCSSSTRGIFAGGEPFNNVIEYAQISTIGNSLDFGDLTINRNYGSSCSSSTRGVFFGGAYGFTTPTNLIKTIEFITISSKGNGTLFGDLTIARLSPMSCSNENRGITSGGYTHLTRVNTIDYITIASTGNSESFGDLTISKDNGGAASTKVRGVFGGGATQHPAIFINIIDYITISSIGNAQDFGDLTQTRNQNSACSDSHGGLGGF
jgi:hypothetical protein